jgi:guanylate kinase
VSKGLILYGAPASGKDSITAALVSKHPEFEHFRRLKVGPGRTSGYRMTSPAQIAALRQTRDAILWENTRYGASYFVDRPGLEQLWQSGRVPVVHLGQIEAVDALCSGTKARWTVVELYARPAVLRDRIRSRGTGDEEHRFIALEQTLRLPAADMRIDTEAVPISEAAEMIYQQLRDES